MDNGNFWRKALVVAAVLLLAGTGTAYAQLQTGNLYGTTADNQGQALPGVTVTLTGAGAAQVQVTNAEGQFRFLGLSPGSWAIKAELEGFSTVDYPNIAIGVGRSTTIEVTLTPALEEVITVTSESPLLDERKVSTGTTVTATELEKIPTARDPWVILQQTPGVLVDRINVGGNESGQQSQYISPGTNNNNSVWAVDGVVITDMGAIGSSPTYYNFDAFEEMQVTTGGTDVSLATGGVTMNMVTKRGTNEWRFSGRYLLTDQDWQSDTSVSQSEFPAAQRATFASLPGGKFSQGNRIISVKDYGGEFGGPIVRDRLWIWGTYGVQKIDLRTAQTAQRPNGTPDFTELESYGGKLNAQVTANNSLTGFYQFGDKIKIGRNASPLRPPPTTWNQSGGTPIYKLEDTHIFNSNFYLTGMISEVSGGFQLVPQGGGQGDPNFPNVVRNSNLVWQNSFQLYKTDRPQDQAKIDGNYFFNTGSASHELRFGIGRRQADVDSLSQWPGLQIVGLQDVVVVPGNIYLGWSATIRNASDTVEYTSAYLQDTLTFGNFTANVGLRYDKQGGTNNAATVPAAPVNQGTLLGGRFDGKDASFEWTDITPRLGLTYALGEDRSTLLRASYSRFADQLGSGTVSFDNPTNYQYGYFYWYDGVAFGGNGDGALTANEVGPFVSFVGARTVNGFLVTDAQVDPNLNAPITDELVVSVEHALMPEFVISLSGTWRNYHDLLEQERLVRENGGPIRTHLRSDYVLGNTNSGTLPNGQPFTAPQFTLRSGVEYIGVNRLENGDREQDYLGLTLGFNKRLSNRWLLRGHFTVTDWTWNIPESEREDPTLFAPGGNRDGDPVVLNVGNGSGAKGNVYINSEWSYDLSGLYQIAPDRPWGFNVAANINGRQGYPIPYSRNRNLGDGFGTRLNQATAEPDTFRLDDIMIINARVEKELTFSDFGLTLSLDGFNLFNESYVLQRQGNLGLALTSPGRDAVLEITSPRIFRIGARFNFR
jgi:hypothetical protein